MSNLLAAAPRAQVVGAAASIALGVALLVAGGRTLTADAAADVTPIVAGAASAAAAARDAPALPASDPRSRQIPSRPAAPVPFPPSTVSFPSHGTTATVVAVGVLASGALQLPDDLHTVGWWAAGALPGADHGTAVLAGHVDTALGIGAFRVLHDVAAGERVDVTDANGVVQPYRVVSRTLEVRTALDPGLFTQDGPPRLVLITCGGRFDEERHHYEDNVVVVAEPVTD